MDRHPNPVHEIRLGTIRASIWANASREQRTFFNVTLSRSYRDGENWKDSASFGRDDLPVLGKVLDLAYAWIWNQGPTRQQERPVSHDGAGA